MNENNYLQCKYTVSSYPLLYEAEGFGLMALCYMMCCDYWMVSRSVYA